MSMLASVFWVLVPLKQTTAHDLRISDWSSDVCSSDLLDNIDIATATSKGILVTNTPDYCVTVVADHAPGLLLSVTRNTGFFEDRKSVVSGKSLYVRVDLGCGRLNQKTNTHSFLIATLTTPQTRANLTPIHTPIY